MATIIKNGNKYRAQVRKKGIYKTATFSTKTEANRWAYALEAQIDAGEYNTTPNILFAELIDKYLKEVTPTKRGKREERYRLLRIAGSNLEIYHYRHSPKSIYANGKTNACKKCSRFPSQEKEPLYRHSLQKQWNGIISKKIL